MDFLKFVFDSLVVGAVIVSAGHLLTLGAILALSLSGFKGVIFYRGQENDDKGGEG